MVCNAYYHADLLFIYNNRTMSELDACLGFLLHDALRRLRRTLTQRSEALRLTQSQWRTLAYLSHYEGVRQIELAEMLDVAPIALARTLDQLETLHWIERREDPQDRRAHRLYLTPDAAPVVSSLFELGRAIEAEAYRGIPEADIATCLRVLQRIRQNLGD